VGLPAGLALLLQQRLMPVPGIKTHLNSRQDATHVSQEQPQTCVTAVSVASTPAAPARNESSRLFASRNMPTCKYTKRT
jgi:hypothetical protein